MKIQQSAEDYLEAMLVLQEKYGYIRSIDIGRFHDLIRNILHKALDHKRRKRDHPGDIEGNQAFEFVDELQF